MLACVHNTTEPGCLQNERRRHKPNKSVSGRIRREDRDRDDVKFRVKDDADGHLIYKNGDTLEHRCTKPVMCIIESLSYFLSSGNLVKNVCCIYGNGL